MYSNINGIIRIRNILCISGIGAKTRLNHKINDIIVDMFFIPTHNVQLSEDVMVTASIHPLFKK